jgi:hypothetical protein
MGLSVSDFVVCLGAKGGDSPGNSRLEVSRARFGNDRTRFGMRRTSFGARG